MLSEYEQNLLKETEGTDAESRSLEKKKTNWPLNLPQSSPVKQGKKSYF